MGRIRQPLRERGLDYASLSDPILVTRAKAGDARALEALCVRHAPRVERLARHLLRDPDDASDAAQEALAKLCVRLKQSSGPMSSTTRPAGYASPSCGESSATRWRTSRPSRRR